jgi:hypothetical protein
MSYATCDHLKEDGVYCQSPALRGQNFCYFHLNIRARRVQMARARRRGESCRLQLPVLDNMHAVLAALQQVGDALADDRIDPKRAGLMLYMLQQTATALNTTPDWKGEREQVGVAQPMRALEVPDVAQQYDLPIGVDLNLPPEAALDAVEQPADPSEPPKQHVRLARMPERAASQADKYFHIPKDPGTEVSFDEMAYELSRIKAGLPVLTRLTEKSDPSGGSDDVEATANVA